MVLLYLALHTYLTENDPPLLHATTSTNVMSKLLISLISSHMTSWTCERADANKLIFKQGLLTSVYH